MLFPFSYFYGDYMMGKIGFNFNLDNINKDAYLFYPNEDNILFIVNLNKLDTKDTNLPNNGYLYFYYDYKGNYKVSYKNELIKFNYKYISFSNKKTNFIPNNEDYLYLNNVENNNYNEISVKLLGYPAIINDTMLERVDLISRGFNDFKNVTNFNKRIAKNNAKNWHLLLELPSTLDIKFLDNGSLYFYIKDSDLINLDFSKVVMIVESY